MKKLILTIGIVLLLFNLHSQSICESQTIMVAESFNICNNESWKLVFEDDFNGNYLSHFWNPVTGVPRDYSFEKQKAWHLPENVVVSDGTLKIITRKLDSPYSGTFVTDWSTDPPTTVTSDFDYTTGEIWSDYKFSYGKFEARVKIPRGKGFFPAFWVFGDNPWHEIDIFEFKNENDAFGNFAPNLLSKKHSMTVHYDTDNDGDSEFCVSSYNGGDFSLDFHVFTLIWEKNRIAWYVDGQLKRTDYHYFTTLGQVAGCVIEDFTPYLRNKIYPTTPMSIIFNLAIQHGVDAYGNATSPDIHTPFPSQLEVDWVRYYAKEPCENLNITDQNQFPLQENECNFLIGENEIINCEYSVLDNHHFQIKASNSISIKPGFFAESGSSFHASIESSICGSTEKNSIDKHGPIYTENKILQNNINKKFGDEIIVFPNPNSGIFTIDFGFLNIINYKVEVINLLGEEIACEKIVLDKTMQLKIPVISKGVYTILLTDLRNGNRTSNNIIIH